MITATKRKTKLPPMFEEEYRSALGECAQLGGEAAMNRAYDLGPRTISEKKSLMETLSIDSARGRGTRLLIQLPTEVLNANPHRAS
jgi:hypothetical protein